MVIGPVKKGLKQPLDPGPSASGSGVFVDFDELVVARHREDLNWLRRVPKRFRVTLYDKGGHPGARHPLPNIGREAHTYLHHIVTRYDDLAALVRRLYLDGPRPLSGKPVRVISCHLGGSSSITGIRNGVAIGTSMGLSPQSGLPQNNRVGDLDSAAVPYVMKTLGLPLAEVERQMTKEGGLLGLSGVSNDLRDIRAAAAAGRAHVEDRLAVGAMGGTEGRDAAVGDRDVGDEAVGGADHGHGHTEEVEALREVPRDQDGVAVDCAVHGHGLPGGNQHAVDRAINLHLIAGKDQVIIDRFASL